MLKIAYFAGIENDLIPLSRALNRIYREKGKIVEVDAKTSSDLQNTLTYEAFCKYAGESDLAIFRLMGGKDSCPGFDALVKQLKNKVKVHIQTDSPEELSIIREFSTVNSEERNLISKYIRYGGEKNFLNLLLFLVNHFKGKSFIFKEPQLLPWEGIYHPDFENIPSLNEYLAKKYVSQRPTVGLWFYRSHWVNGNTRTIDALIREIEKQGANVIPVFLQTLKDVNLGNKGAIEVAESYFIRNGKPIIDVLVNLIMFSLSMFTQSRKALKKSKSILEKLGVPVLQGITTTNTLKKWEGTLQGLNPVDVSISVAMPEFDGVLITVPVATKKYEVDSITGIKIAKYEPIPERINKFVRLVLNWAKLRHIPNREKKVAIIFHNYPPRNDRIGTAFGLDSPASVWNILRELKKAKYKLNYLPRDGQSLIKDIINQVTNDRRWASSEELAKRAVDKVSIKQYIKWFEELPLEVQDKMIKAWGKPPGKLFSYKNKLLIPGIINGNIFIGLQPPRGFLEDPAAIYHSPDHPIPHHYYAYYRWIRDVFKANVIMHIGKHGSLEWLPGKSVGLSESCFPDIAISDLPNIYPYIINNPGEGTQAKRRSYCCIIDHLIPVMHNADTYDEMADLEVQLNEYYQAKNFDQPGRLSQLKRSIWEKVCQAKLNHDLKINEKTALADFDKFLEKLHGYLSEIKDTQIRDGLHILGEPPINSHLDEFLVALTRLPNGDIPSLRQSLAKIKGYDYDKLLMYRGKLNPNGKTNGQIIDELNEFSLRIIKKLHEMNFKEKVIENELTKILGEDDPNVKKVLFYISHSLVPKLADTTRELTNTLLSSDGFFVPPGPSGAPTRGMADILPTGRNFYSLDPYAIPSPAAWRVGVKMGDDLIKRFLQDEGKYPENVGIVIWGSPTMRTQGESVAEALYLMGVKPSWRKQSGRVKGIEIIPLEKLKRPRIDVTFRISGFFRDAFPNVVELLDEAVQMVADLDEPFESNFIAKHVSNEVKEKLAKGIDPEKAKEEACYRVFGCKPGAYGAGVNDAIDSKNWKDEKDLGKVYVTWGGYVYGKKKYGRLAPEDFKKRLSVMDIAVKNVDTREYDMMDSDDFYSYHGGMIAAVKAFKGKSPRSYIGDSSDPERTKVRTAEEEAKYVFRARVLNPRWIKSMQRHGYKGAGDISRMVDIAFGWDATAEVLEDWMYEELAKKYALDKNMQEWFKKVNPYALQNITERLLEAIKRGMWQAEEKMKKELQKIYLDIEGILEENQVRREAK
ncbi:cobalamin biosynthesis protein CobN [Candidatus Aerophobetes bacterium]|uniref:Cobalamin biosynthesis protein CobN n=1 Tax=Aerophobetes bacterium TaxID=2030807 RepID=A0A662DE08_UNCAE|nr:MAG: cobalamin biosynthesis protein CobN [Candidatus Aerophobetes bacterium]